MRISADQSSPFFSRLCYRAMVLFNGEFLKGVIEADEEGRWIRLLDQEDVDPEAWSRKELTLHGDVEIRFFDRAGNQMDRQAGIDEFERDRERVAARGR